MEVSLPASLEWKRISVDFSDIKRRLEALAPRLQAARGFL